MKSSIVLFLMFTTFPSFAASNMKPGLWEHSQNVKSSNPEMVKFLNMQNQGGVGSKPQRFCFTKDQAANLEIPEDKTDSCKKSNFKRTDSSISFDFTCPGDVYSTGKTEFKLTSPSSYTGLAKVNINVQGVKDKYEVSLNGKWISTDCADVKPLPSKK